jgi:short-subunit dehydrogenase
MNRKRRLGPGQTVLVTGASSGLGRAIALELARLGCGLVLAGRDRNRLDTAALEALGLGAAEATVVVAELSSREGVNDLLDQLETLGRPIDGLVNNAGAGRAGPWAEGTVDSDRGQLDLLVLAPMALTRHFLARWRALGRGAVLNIASTGAFQPGPHTAVYYAAKAFLLSWSLALAREERSWLTVTTVCPGAMATGFSTAAGKRDVPGAPGPGGTARAAVAAWNKNGGLVVPGFFNKMMVFASRIAPASWTAAAVEAIQRSVSRRP